MDLIMLLRSLRPVKLQSERPAKEWRGNREEWREKERPVESKREKSVEKSGWKLK